MALFLFWTKILQESRGWIIFCDLYNWMEKTLQNSAHVRR